MIKAKSSEINELSEIVRHPSTAEWPMRKDLVPWPERTSRSESQLGHYNCSENFL